MAESFATIDDYIASFGDDVRPILERVREAIHAGAPGGEERIKYGMPAIAYEGRHTVYFAGWKNHVAVYPLYHTEDEELERQFAPFRAAKDALHFPYTKPVPYDLIERAAAIIAG